MKKIFKKISTYFLSLSLVLLPSISISACQTKENISKQEVNKEEETLNLFFNDNNINTLENESYQSKEILAKYKNSYHACNFEIIDSLPWMSIKNNCFCIANNNKLDGIYHPSIIAKSKTINGLQSLPKQITIQVKKPKDKINNITWPNCQDKYQAVAGEEYQICPIDLVFDTSLPIDAAINQIKIKINVIDNMPVDTNGNDLFFVKLIDNKFYLYLSEYSLSSTINYLSNFQLELQVINTDGKNPKVYLTKTINIEVIEGLQYIEDGFRYKRKTSKDNWTIALVEKQVKEICFNEPKIIYHHVVDKIGHDAADQHENLTTIKINYPLKEIGRCAFKMCDKLHLVDINVENVDNFAFLGCKNLTRKCKINVTKSIGTCAFRNCPNLTTCITLGKDFESFYADAFEQEFLGEAKFKYYKLNIKSYYFILNMTSTKLPIVYGEIPIINDRKDLFVISLPDDLDLKIFYNNLQFLQEEKRNDASWWQTLAYASKLWDKNYRDLKYEYQRLLKDGKWR